MSNTDSDIDWECSCSECGAHCEDLLSPVCFACRQKMTLVPIEEYKRRQARIDKLRWALGRSANQVRVLKKEVADAEQGQRDTFCHACDEMRKLNRRIWALEDMRCSEVCEAFDAALIKLEAVRAENAESLKKL